jgi:hypothetical protein
MQPDITRRTYAKRTAVHVRTVLQPSTILKDIRKVFTKYTHNMVLVRNSNALGQAAQNMTKNGPDGITSSNISRGCTQTKILRC